MTDSLAPIAPTPPPPGRRGTAASPPRRGPRFWPTAAASVATFAVIFEFLAFQLTSGDDPALGPQGASGSQPSSQPVLNRRVIQTRVVHDPPITAAPEPSTTSPPVSSAPAPAAPSTAVVPAPAPAPVVTAPPVTSSS